MSSFTLNNLPENTTTLPQPTNNSQSNFGYIIFFFYFTFVPLFSCLLMLRFYQKVQRVKFKLSGQLTIHLFLWILCTTLSVIYTVPILLSLLFSSFVEDNVFLIVLRGSLNMAAVESIQLSTTFLSLSRIQSILIPSIGTSKYKHYLHFLSLTVFFTSFIVVFILTFQRAYSPKVQEGGTVCVAFSCRLIGQIDDLSFYKLLIGLVNIGIGTIFVFLYCSFAKKSAIRKENRKNFTVLLILATELLFTVTPNALHLLTDSAVVPYLNIRINTTVAIGYSTDALVTSIVYLYTYSKSILTSHLKVTPVNPNQQGQLNESPNNT